MGNIALSAEHELRDIALSEINSDVYNVRGRINPQTVVDLARRIKEEGLANPIQVCAVDDPSTNAGKPYRLFAGFRRFMAHRINSAETIQCRIYHGLTEVDEVVVNFTENIMRSDLTLLQEAEGLAHLQALRDLTQKELSEYLGKSPKWVQTRLWLNDLEPEIKKDVDQGMIKAYHIDILHEMETPEERYAYVKQVKRAKLIGDKPRVNPEKPNVFSKKVRKRVDIFEIQDHILEAFGSGVLSKLPPEAKMLLVVLGWTAGEATTMELYEALRKMAVRNNLYYEIPARAYESLQDAAK